MRSPGLGPCDMNVSQDDLNNIARYSTPTIANAIETFDAVSHLDGFTDPSIRCIFPELPRIVGFAATARISCQPGPGEPLASFWDHIASVPVPRILVVEDVDQPTVATFWGEVNASICTALGAVAVA